MMHKNSDFPTLSRYMLQVRFYPAFTAALGKIANREFMTISGFIRAVLIERLKAEGIEPAMLIHAANAPTRKARKAKTRR
jgi:hypothetical protein